jgi:hypothetical protein
MKQAVALGCLLAFTAWGAGKKAPPKAPPPPPPAPVVLKAPSEKLAEAMGGKVGEQLTAATKFEIARTSYEQGIRPKPEVAIGSDFQRLGAWQAMEKQEVEKLRAIFYDEKNFRLAADVSGCNFTPDVAFQLSNESIDTLQLLISFKCNQVLFFSVRTGGRSVPGVALDLKPGRKSLLALVKELLRQDAALQALK